MLDTGADLRAVLTGGYVTWWQSIHDDHPAIALGIAADAYTMSWGNFGAQCMGNEPREAYNNRTTEEADYRKIVEDPWFGSLSAASSANDVFAALGRGITIDHNGPQDASVKAAAHFLRGVSWGYMGLIFDQGLMVDENTNLTAAIPFVSYEDMIAGAVDELDAAIDIAEAQGDNFIHNYFNGLTLSDDQFIALCHSYAARFLAQWPRTQAENAQVDWTAVLAHAEKGITSNFAPLADGRFWVSYQKYIYAEGGQGPFWARIDQRLIAAMDPSQPARYPEVSALGEPPLASPQAHSADARLASDFIFLSTQNFPVERGEWFFSHYKLNRNQRFPDFAGDGISGGPMPVFLAADNELLRAEALLRLQRLSEAVSIINAGSRTQRGQLAVLPAGASAATIEQAIMYERAIELLGTAPMSLWFDRRRIAPRVDHTALDALGGLQTGTPAQLPVPASELKVRSEPPYNFGGPQDPEGVVKVF